MTQIEMERIGDEMYRVPIPVPFPMKYVYCYVGRETDGWSIIDVGFRYPEAIRAWEAVFRQLGIKPRHVRAIYITHFHPDQFWLGRVDATADGGACLDQRAGLCDGGTSVGGKRASRRAKWVPCFAVMACRMSW